MQCRKILLVDACRSGYGKESDDVANMYEAKLQQLKNGLTYLSSSGFEKSHESDFYANGIFTEALLNN